MLDDHSNSIKDATLSFTHKNGITKTNIPGLKFIKIDKPTDKES